MSFDVLPGDDPESRAKVAELLDILQCIALVEPDDSSNPWARARILVELGMHLEAAEAFLRAADLLELEAADGSGITGDEADAAVVALELAAESLERGGRPLSAFAVELRLASIAGSIAADD